MDDLLLVLTTMPNDERAEELALALVNDRVAACVTVHAPMTSVYRWKGAVERDTERQLAIKTTRDRLPALESRLRALHPYELPEFIVIAVAAGEEYLRWVRRETEA
jgi:periplasmic divalent cation tolerance protein